MTMRPYLLALIALGLAALVGRDYWPAAPGVPQPQPVAQTRQPVLLNPVSQRQPSEFAALFDRPLFDPTRSRPALEAAPPPQITVPDAPQVTELPGQPPRPVLMGTVTSPWPGGAYLGDDAGGPVVFLRPGQAAMGLSLEEVRATSAIFKGPDGEVTLSLQQMEAAPQAVPNELPADMPADRALPAP